ncbi:MAG: hypothetical protein LBJ00_17430 [Planctomycetaceae bacterium]|jgi:photosystem II stability/assembly factor-like uncharacterized protein|nr:hypothetical protein [Planctomycetaceae bacterium]
MIPVKNKFIISFAIILIAVLVNVGITPAQNQRLQYIIDEFKTQNPDRINTRNPTSQPPSHIPPPPPSINQPYPNTPNFNPNPNPNLNPNFTNPNSNPNPNPNYNFTNPNYPNTASHFPVDQSPTPNTTPPETTVSTTAKTYIGDPRDPLNPKFDPSWANSPLRQLLPCDEMLSDARINDVFFVNSHLGWAVGDRGLVWHTDNGGKTWQLQPIPISCILKSVWFINEQLGIIVGGYRFPHSPQSKGLIFVTFDGGQNWKPITIEGTPFFHRVKMFDHSRGIIVGESSEHCPSGLFTTKDGGRTWTPHQSDKTNGWLTADFTDGKDGIGIDTKNKIYPTNFKNQIKLPEKQLPDFSNKRFNHIKFAKTNSPANTINGWLVGCGSSILTTTDSGLNWNIVAGKLPVGEAEDNLDLNTVEVLGNDVWVAGSPGTFIYHSNDAGKTWKATPSGINATIHKITFVDNLNGWAVGDLGTILATTDGGVNWTKQRIGAERLAVLGVFGKTSDKIPFEAFAYLCANQGYVGGSMFIFRDNTQLDNSKHVEDAVGICTAHEAMLRAGVSVTLESNYLKNLPDEIQTTYEKLVTQINEQSNNKVDQIRKNLVCAIRQWRPDVIIGTNISDTKNPVRELVLREIMEAIKLAADASVFPEQISQLGLSAWKVKKVHLALLDDIVNDANGGTVGGINIRTAEPIARLGGSIEEAVYISHGLVDRGWWAKPTVLGFSTPFDNTPTTGNRDLFAGVDVQTNVARRFTIDFSANWLEVTQRIKKRQYTDRIIRDMIKNARVEGKSPSQIRLVSHVNELTRKIDRDCAVQMLIEMGRRYHANGDIGSAADAYGIVVSQYADHPLVRHALLWMSQYYAAEETAWRDFLKNPAGTMPESIKNNNTTTANVLPNDYNKINGNIISAAGQGRLYSDILAKNRINLSGDEFQIALKQMFDLRLDNGLEFAEYSRRGFPDLADEVRVRFSWASVLRRRGLDKEALRYYQIRGGDSYDDVWSMRARAESKLWEGLNGSENNNATKNTTTQDEDLMIPVIVAAFTPNIPFLDGEFDNSPDREGQTWSRSKLYSLTPAKPQYKLNDLIGNKRFSAGCSREKQSLEDSKNFGTKVMFMYDSHHLYIGLRCPKVSGVTYPPIPEHPRVRDSNILDQDRVEILIDVDRDYNTFYSWTVDSRGWAVDSYFGDKTWNSDCYIARKDDKDAWYIEMAISLDSLTGNLPAPKSVWGVGVRRIVPNKGIECWNAENSLNLGEGLGFLMFGQ